MIRRLSGTRASPSTSTRDDPENVETQALALAANRRFEEAVATQQALLDAARGRAEPDLVSHLEYNL